MERPCHIIKLHVGNMASNKNSADPGKQHMGQVKYTSNFEC